jgi:hypothetical protein
MAGMRGVSAQWRPVRRPCHVDLTAARQNDRSRMVAARNEPTKAPP